MCCGMSLLDLGSVCVLWGKFVSFWNGLCIMDQVHLLWESLCVSLCGSLGCAMNCVLGRRSVFFGESVCSGVSLCVMGESMFCGESLCDMV